MTGALALGHAGLRLRSRRVRSGSSHRLSPALVVATLAIASGVGFFAVEAGLSSISIRTESQPLVDASPVEHPQLPASLRSIDAQVERGVAQEGLLVAAYESGQIDRNELQRQLGDVLSAYVTATSDVASVDMPPEMQASQRADEESLRALTQSAAELSQAFDDGDQARVATALARSLQAMAQLHTSFGEVSAR